MATVENFILRIKTDGSDNIKKLSADVSAATDKLNGLAAAIPLAAMGAFVVSAVKMAESLQDLSDATGISVSKIAAFSNALQEAGGKASNAERIITGFFNTIEAAADGSLKLQDAFKKVGVSLDDLRNLSEEDLLKKTVNGLAAMEAGSERTRLATTLLSRAFRSVDPTVFAEALRTGDFSKIEQSAKNSAELIGNMEKAYKNLQTAALEALNPILKALGDQKLGAENAALAIKIVGITLGLAFGASILKSITTINAALGVTAGLSNLIGKGPLSIIAKLAAGGAAAATTGIAIDELSKRNDELARSAEQAAAALDFPVPETAKGSAGRTVIEAISEEEKARRESVKRITASRIEAEKIASQTTAENSLNAALQSADAIQKVEATKVRDLAKINSDSQAEIAKMAAEVRSNDKLSAGQIATEIAERTKEIEGRAALERIKITAAAAEQIKKINTDLLVRQVKDQQELAQQYADELARAADELQKQNSQGIELARAYAEQVSLARERSDLEYMMRNNREEDRRLALEINQIETARIQKLRQLNSLMMEPADRQKAIDSINATAEIEKAAAEERRNRTIAEQEDFAAGWERAWRLYAENAQKANDQARSYVDIFTRGFEDSFVRLVQTGKLSFKELANSLIAEFARAQARSILGNVFRIITGGMTIDPSGIGITAGDSPFSATAADIFGRRAGGGPVSRGRGYMVGENGPELFIPASSGNIMNNSDTMNLGGVGTNITYNIQAVDAQSFRSLVARDPQFIYQVTEAGRRSQPTRRLA